MKEIENNDIMIKKCSIKLGALTALLPFFAKLERLGVGTKRAERMAEDIVWQNDLHGGIEIMKEKSNQEKCSEERKRTVRVLLRAMRERIAENIVLLKRWIEKLIKDRLSMEGLVIGRGKKKKLKQQVRKLLESVYGRKWKEELEEEGKHLKLKYGRVKVATDEEIIAGVKWSDSDIGKPEPENFRDNVMVMGNINPPLTDA